MEWTIAADVVIPKLRCSGSMFDAATEQWVKTGDLQTPRYDHAMSAVKWIDIKPYLFANNYFYPSSKNTCIKSVKMLLKSSA